MNAHSRVILVGFAVVMGLMAIPTVVGVNRMIDTQAHLTLVTQDHLQKAEILHTIRDIIRQRQTAVRNILLTNDYFKKDAEIQQMYHLAMEATTYIRQLKKMAMSKSESELFDKIRETAMQAYPLQKQLVERSFSGESVDKLSGLLDDALNAQSDVMNYLNIAIKEHVSRAEESKKMAQASYKENQRIIFSFSAVALMLGIFVVAYIIRFTNKQANTVNSMVKQLTRNRDELEYRVKERTAELSTAYDLALTSNKAKASFFANMSHELRTPLNAIIGYSEMLLEDDYIGKNRTCVNDLSKVQSSGKHLLHLINDILDLSKIEAGKLAVGFEWIDIGTFLDDVKSTIEPLVSNNNNQLTTSVNANGQICTDALRLKQVLVNLLGNACKFTSDGSITLEVRQHNNDTLEFIVSDTGIGIEPDRIMGIFEEFSQVDTSATRKYGGTGLGLAISKQLVELLKGKLDVESKLGSGTTFSFIIPREYNKENQNKENQPEQQFANDSNIVSIDKMSHA